MENEVVLLDLGSSPFAMRARLGLAVKGVKYEAKEEDLINKSSLLLEMNPVHKLIPVLIHNGKPICESLVVLQYIDEVWHDHKPLLLPSDPYQRSQARFWADYVEKKVFSNSRILFRAKGEKLEEGKREFIEGLKTLEGELGEKPYFGGDTIGYVDVALLPMSVWFYCFETRGNFSVEAECPKITTWAKRCMQNESVSHSLPHPHEVYDYALKRRQQMGLD